MQVKDELDRLLTEWPGIFFFFIILIALKVVLS
jgi:hypothetical protein